MRTPGTAYRDDAEPILEINTTPLIDVMLVLLIMFIVTIPIQPQATRLQVSPGEASIKAEPDALHVSVGADQRIVVEGESVESPGDFASVLHQMVVTRGGNPQIFVDIQDNAQYALVAGVLAQIQREGLQHLNIVGIDRFSGTECRSGDPCEARTVH